MIKKTQQFPQTTSKAQHSKLLCIAFPIWLLSDWPKSRKNVRTCTQCVCSEGNGVISYISAIGALFLTDGSLDLLSHWLHLPRATNPIHDIGRQVFHQDSVACLATPHFWNHCQKLLICRIFFSWKIFPLRKTGKPLLAKRFAAMICGHQVYRFSYFAL